MCQCTPVQNHVYANKSRLHTNTMYANFWTLSGQLSMATSNWPTIFWLINQPINQLTNQLTNQPTNQLNNQPTNGRTDAWTEWLTDWPTNQIIDKLTNGQTNWPNNWRINWLIDWPTDWPTINRLTNQPTDRQIYISIFLSIWVKHGLSVHLARASEPILMFVSLNHTWDSFLCLLPESLQWRIPVKLMSVHSTTHMMVKMKAKKLNKGWNWNSCS